MSKVIEVTTWEELTDILDGNDRVVVCFTAPSWCVPCQRLKPHYEAAAEKATGHVFVSVDMEKADYTLEPYTELIKSVPTVMESWKGNFIGEVKGRTAISILNELADSL